jgi:uncharacterized membrane protein YdjX (TVP38/TMEM64 family)
MTLIGFAYGIWPGFLLAIVSSMLGAGIAFVSVRVSHYPLLTSSVDNRTPISASASISAIEHAVSCADMNSASFPT